GAPRSRGRAPCCWDPEVRRWPPLAPYEPPRTAGRERKCQKLPSTILLICSVYKQKVDEGMRRKHAGYTTLPPPSLCVIRTVAVAKVRLFFLYAAFLWRCASLRPCRHADSLA